MDKRNKILIVDDSEINRSLLADMLSGEYSLMEASDGLEAVALISQHHTELSMVLLDIVMPVMDGYTFLSIMKADPAYSYAVWTGTGNFVLHGSIEALQIKTAKIAGGV